MSKSVRRVGRKSLLNHLNNSIGDNNHEKTCLVTCNSIVGFGM